MATMATMAALTAGASSPGVAAGNGAIANTTRTADDAFRTE